MLHERSFLSFALDTSGSPLEHGRRPLAVPAAARARRLSTEGKHADPCLQSLTSQSLNHWSYPDTYKITVLLFVLTIVSTFNIQKLKDWRLRKQPEKGNREIIKQNHRLASSRVSMRHWISETGEQDHRSVWEDQSLQGPSANWHPLLTPFASHLTVTYCKYLIFIPHQATKTMSSSWDLCPACPVGHWDRNTVSRRSASPPVKQWQRQFQMGQNAKVRHPAYLDTNWRLVPMANSENKKTEKIHFKKSGNIWKYHKTSQTYRIIIHNMQIKTLGSILWDAFA